MTPTSDGHTGQIRKAKAIPPFESKPFRFDRVKVAETALCGMGVFATAPVKKGRAVGRVLGERKPEGFRSDYCVEFDGGALEPFAPYRFLNHSCDPNCEFIEWQIDDQSLPQEEGSERKPICELWIHALRDIQIGEELTVDYGWDWRAAIPCKCGSPNCRGWICKPEDIELCKARFAEEEPANAARSAPPQ